MRTRTIAFLACCLSAVWLCASVEAQTVVRPRACVTTPTVAPVYHQPYYAHSYSAYYPTVVKEYVPYVVPVEVYPRDHYYSLDSYYRDKLLVDAIVGRLVQSAPVDQPKAKPTPQQPANQPEAPAIKTDVPEGLAALVQAKCIKCHAGGAGGRVDLSDLSIVPEGVRWQCYGLVNAGEMPKGLEPIPDKDVQVFYEWAKTARKSKVAQK